MPKQPDERVGRVVDDRYQIVAAMAAGSMGAVYRAERVPVGKVVAIKFLHASFATDGEFLARFERETQVMSKLAHPNCVSVVDFGVWEGAPYLVMDFVAGRTLRSVIDDSPLAPARALMLARQIAAGLAHAHAQEITHRDIKPANIMISDEIGTGERVRILDFGLARLRGGGQGRDATQTNVVVGTPNYMAPEQTVGGGTVDARTDIYAAGVVLFEMIVGEKPFVAEETLQLLGMHRAAPIPRIADRLPPGVEVPEGVQALIDKAMAKAPADRYQSGVEMAEAIDAVFDGLSAGRPAGELRVPGSAAARKQLAVAPTMVGIDSGAIPEPVAAAVAAAPRASRSSSMSAATTEADVMPSSASAYHGKPWKRPLLGGLILFGGIALGAGYLIHRHHADESAAIDAAVVASAKPGEGSGSAIAGSASDSGSGSDSGSASMPGSGSGSGSGPEVGSASETGSGSATGSAGSGSGSGSGSAAAEIEIDPTTADDPNPEKPGSNATDEAEDAPDKVDDTKPPPIVHSPSAPAPVLAASVDEAIRMMKAGNRELAIASLRSLWKEQPKSSYIPFLLGNLYTDKLWWGVAMEHYKAAINKNGGYKLNQILNQNVIRMLASPKTQKSASAFLRSTIGRPAIPYLRVAAAHDNNPTVKKLAAALAKSIH